MNRPGPTYAGGIEVRYELKDQHTSRVQSKPRPVIHYHKSAVRQQGAALPSLVHWEARTRQSCEPTRIERTQPAIAPRASWRDDDRQQSSIPRLKCRSLNQLVEQRCEAAPKSGPS